MHDPSLLVLSPGAVFHERYQIVRCIKAGGMGAVYEVIDVKTEVRRALKVMLPGIAEKPEMRARFELEARITGRVESDHIVRVTDADVDAGAKVPFLVMELLRGDELGSLLAKRKALSRREVVVYLHQASLALDKTHDAGIVHRDLKPENLFLTYRDDGSPCIKILDFGIAKLLEHSMQKTGTIAMGTLLYMSPEQARGKLASIGPSTDIYALGHMAYTLLVGEAYWAEEFRRAPALLPFLATVVRGVHEPPSRRAGRRDITLPAAFDRWFLKATAVKPKDRFERATSAVAMLADALSVQVPRPSLPPIEPDSAAARRDPAVAGAPLRAGENAETAVFGPDSDLLPNTETATAGHVERSAPRDPVAPTPAYLDSLFLEGIWKTPGGSTYCVRLINNELRCAYCDGGDSWLTGEVSEWRFAGNMAFARFKETASLAGDYIYLEIESQDRLVGALWQSGNVPPTFEAQWLNLSYRSYVIHKLKFVYLKFMKPVTWTRSTSQALPKWAEQFFKECSTANRST